MEGWGNRLQQAISRQNIHKSYALAFEMGVAESTVSRWKQSGPISLQHAVKLCEILDVSMDWMFTGREKFGAPPHIYASRHHDMLFRKIEAMPARATKALTEFIDAVS